MNPFDPEQLAEWIEKQLDDLLAGQDFEQLQQLLIANPEARELYLDLMHQHAHLQLEHVHLSAATPPESLTTAVRSSVSQPINKRVWLAGFAMLAASLLFVVWWQGFLATSRQSIPSVAQITESSDAQWGDCSLPTAVGSQLFPGRLKIDRGLATIRFASGAELTLEAPADLEIESPLSGRLFSGTAVVDVPDSAHGFTLTTPTAVAIDYGTSFAVTVEDSTKTSSIEVLDGEVEVKHIASEKSLRLKETQRVVASERTLSDLVTSNGEAKLIDVTASMSALNRLHRITTADGSGADVSISRSQEDDVKKNSHAELVLIKNPFAGYEHFARKGYFRFDLRSLPEGHVTSAKFVLTLMPSGLGFASKVDDCEFTVYCLTDESGDDWPAETLTWQNAPANLDGAAQVDTSRARELGRFTVSRGVQHGQFAIEGNDLVQFLNGDTNRSVTFIVVRDSKERDPGGLVHCFVSQKSSAGNPPTLLLSTDAQ